MVSRLKQLVLLPLPILALPLFLFGTSRTDDGPFRADHPTRVRKLVICSPQWEGIRFEFEDAFRRHMHARDGSDVEFTWYDQGGGTKILRWIEEQFAQRPDGIDADLMFGGGTDPYDTLKKKGLLARYDPSPEVLDGVPAELAGFPILDPDRTWFGTCLTSFGIMVNRRVFELVPELRGLDPKTWEDLCDPRLHGWVGGADPRGSSSYHTVYEILLQAHGFAHGFEVIRLMSGNTTSFTKFSAEVPKICAVGQTACAPAIDQYALAQIDRVGDAVVSFRVPDHLSLVNPDALGILKGAKNRETAELFVDFMLSAEAARLWMLRRGEDGGPRRYTLNRLAIRPATYAETKGRTNLLEDPFQRPLSIRYDYARASERWTILNDALGALVIDTHRELAAAVEAYHGLTGETKRQAAELLFANPFTEDELGAMAGREWKEEKMRETLRAQWLEFARERYGAVVTLARLRAADGSTEDEPR